MNRYSLVVHLESAAIDTSLYAQLAENNPARHESEEEARAQDLRTQQAWATHPNVAMIRNMLCGEDFELKKQLTVNAVFEHLGLTTVGATTTARKMYLLKTHVPSAIFERECIRTDVFTIQRPSSATTRPSTASSSAAASVACGRSRSCVPSSRAEAAATSSMRRASGRRCTTSCSAR